MNFKLGINWTKSAIALALLCAVFGFSAMAQTNLNERLDAQAVTALIEELTDGLLDFIEDEEVFFEITEKWDARRDLAGKTRAQILQLLFADVGSFITDEDTRNNIWKNWVEEEYSEDETPVEAPQNPVTPTVVKPQATPPPPVNTPANRLQGTVKSFNEQKGYGFITPDDGGPDLFVHFRSVQGNGSKYLKEGTVVTFIIVIGRKGERVADEVQAL